MQLLKNENEFLWYKRELDVAEKYEHKHHGSPEKYPCVAISERADSGNTLGGVDRYHHSFVYQQDVACKQCGHVETVWPEQMDYNIEEATK